MGASITINPAGIIRNTILSKFFVFASLSLIGSRTQHRSLLRIRRRLGGSWCEGRIFAQINPWRVIDFSSDIFLAQSSRQFIKIYVEKVVKPNAEQLSAHD